MNKLQATLDQIKKEKRIGLMTHVVIGYPTLEGTQRLVTTMADSGVDFIELQIPFSDPIADGPTIMRACEKSLRNGTKTKDAFEIANKLSKKVSVPLLFMSYYNTIFKYGVEKFCRNAERAGIVGLIVPNMPIEEEPEEHFFTMCRKYKLNAIHVISPVSTAERLIKNAEVATGFVYATARQGITGARGELDTDIARYLRKVKKAFPIPVALGFGISKKEHIQALKGYADIAVIGSALLDVISGSNNLEKDVKDFLSNLKVVE